MQIVDASTLLKCSLKEELTTTMVEFLNFLPIVLIALLMLIILLLIKMSKTSSK